MIYLLFLLGLVLVLINAGKVLTLEAAPSNLLEKEREGKINWSKSTPAVSLESGEITEHREKGKKSKDDEQQGDKQKIFKENLETFQKEVKEQVQKGDKNLNHVNSRNKTGNLHEMVYGLTKKGKDIEEIARQLNIGKGEVEFILALRR